MNADRSRADLVRLLRAPEGSLFGQCAGLLGFERRSDSQAPLTMHLPAVGLGATFHPPPASNRTETQVHAKQATFLRVVAAKHFDTEDTSKVQSTVLPGRQGSQPREHAPEPLVPWPRLWRHLRPHLCQPTLTHEVDVPALVSRFARAENITTVPRLRRAHFPTRPQVVVDRTFRQRPFWSDQDYVARNLARWITRASGDPFPLFDGVSPGQGMALGYSDQPCPDFRGRMVLLLGDLGAYGGAEERKVWREAGRWLIGRGAILRALVPAPWWRVDVKLANQWHAIPWAHSEGRAERLDTRERQRRADQLLILLSPALRIEPGLLRRARRLLIPGGSDSGTEVDILGHPAVIGYSAVALTLDAKWKRLLEERFDELDPSIQQKLRRLLHDWHKELRPEISVEERFCMSLRLPELFTKGERDELHDFIRQAAVAIDSQDAKGTLSPSVAAWFRELRARLPDAVWTDPSIGVELRRACAIAYRNDPNFHPPPGFGAVEMQIMARGLKYSPTRWRLWQVADGLLALPAGVSLNGGPPEPRPMLGQCFVGSALAEITAGVPHLIVSKPGQIGVRYALSTEAVTIPLPQAPEHLVLTTDKQELRLDVIEKPEWAKRVGRDPFGLWVEFEYKGVAQRMRWIAPGRFWMGEPEPGVDVTSAPRATDTEILDLDALPDLPSVYTPTPEPLQIGVTKPIVSNHGTYTVRPPTREHLSNEPKQMLPVLPKPIPAFGGRLLLHEVELFEGYWLADTACTQDLWLAVMGDNPSFFKERANGENSRPVETVSWVDCQAFLERLNQTDPRLNLRLPTESEWEQACRAGTTTPFSFGTGVTTSQVNYDGYPDAYGARAEHRDKTVPVMSLPANPWGLYEMHGNVYEWCQDWYAPYQPGLATDPVMVDGPVAFQRVVRGGAYLYHAARSSSAARYAIKPNGQYDIVGFRFAQGRQVPRDTAEGAMPTLDAFPDPTAKFAIATESKPDSTSRSASTMNHDIQLRSGWPGGASEAHPTGKVSATPAESSADGSAQTPKRPGFLARIFGKKDKV